MVRQKSRRSDYSMRDPIPLEEGRLNLLLRGARYYARIWSRDEKKYRWRSLRTGDLVEAKRAARKLLFEAETKESRGLPLTSKSMSTVIDGYVAFRERQVERGQTSKGMLRQVKRISRFWKEFIGRKAVEDVTESDFRDFVEWRRDYYSRMSVLPRNARLFPSDKEIQFNIMVGKAIIRWASQKGWRDPRDVPRFAFTASILRVRPGFDFSDYTKLLNALKDRIQRSSAPKFKRSRELLFYYVVVLANSGIRTGEANNLKIRDVEPFTDDLGKKNFHLHVKGKVAYRPAVFRAEAAPILEEWLAKRSGASPNERLFVMPDGSPIKFLGDQFKAALKEANILEDRFGQPYTLYSLRHFYALQAVKHGIDVYRIAKNMGTSVQMIEKYYAKSATSREFATSLGGIKFSNISLATLKSRKESAKAIDKWVASAAKTPKK